MSDINRLVYAILEFLEQQVQSGTLNEDATESVEVSMQCLESAYGVSTTDDVIRSQLSTGRPLLDIFNSASATNRSCSTASLSTEASGGSTKPAADVPLVISEEEKIKAELLKSEGNEFMKKDRYEDAVECYSKSINIDKNNAVYYCNRAAAYHKLNKQQQAIDDGNKAIMLDPKYSKAFGRLGLAYSCMNNHQKAKESFTKALELDPTNEGHRANLNIAEQKIQDSSMGGMQGGFGGQPSFGGMDLGSVLNNPMLMNMASQMMSNPQMQQMMQGILGQGMGGGFGGGQVGGGSTAPNQQPSTTSSSANQTPSTAQPDSSPVAQPDGMSNLLRAGQQLAQQVQQQNPELVEQLKQQFQQMPDGNHQQPPPDGGAGGV